MDGRGITILPLFIVKGVRDVNGLFPLLLPSVFPPEKLRKFFSSPSSLTLISLAAIGEGEGEQRLGLSSGGDCVASSSRSLRRGRDRLRYLVTVCAVLAA
ncbi:hypothetical protein Dimus_038759 [Dionaea muscipula]